MTAALVITGRLGGRGPAGPAADPGGPAASGRGPRVARLLALAIHLERWRADGVVMNYAALARLGRVSRARVSQVMALLHLAPDLQERVLFLPPTRRGAVHGRQRPGLRR